MQALSLTQPYATLVAVAATYPDLGKHNETRSWGLSHKLPLTIAIHAAKGLGPVGGERGLSDLCEQGAFFRVLSKAGYQYGARIAVGKLPRGAVVAVVDVIDLCRVEMCVPLERGDQSGYKLVSVSGRIYPLPDEPDLSFGDYSAGRFVWKLNNIRSLLEPIPAKGARGLWELDTATAAAVTQQLNAPTRGQGDG